LFSYASKLSKKFGIPWIADYRDPWSHNQEHQKNRLQTYWNRMLEKKTVRSAAHITSVSSFVQRKIDSIIPNKSFTILPNGYDPILIDAVSQTSQSSTELNIGFVGTIYEWHPIESFLKVTEQFLRENPQAKLRLNFYGTNIQKELSILIEEKFQSLRNHTIITPRMPNDEVLKKLAKNNVVLLFNYYSYMGTKIFDYLGLRRKIILCYSDDIEARKLKEKYYRIEEFDTESKNLQADLIQETNAGIIVKDAAQLREVLTDLWQEFSSSGQISCDSIGIEKFSRKVQVDLLAKLLKSL
jgi:glycosyltransferase involved in cell wall biosynthesis